MQEKNSCLYEQIALNLIIIEIDIHNYGITEIKSLIWSWLYL